MRAVFEGWPGPAPHYPTLYSGKNGLVAHECILDIRPIKDAVHSDVETSRAVYDWVVTLCVALGANEKDLVPFEKYAAAAQSLGSPSSVVSATSHGNRRACVESGITGTNDRLPTISGRATTRTGRRLSGRSKRNQRMSPWLITATRSDISISRHR